MTGKHSVSTSPALDKNDENDIYQVNEDEKSELVELIDKFCKQNEYLEAQTLFRSLSTDLQNLDEVFDYS